MTIAFATGASNGFFIPQEVKANNIKSNKILLFMMFVKMVKSIHNMYIGTMRSSKYFFLIISYLMISTNSFALDQMSNVKMLNSSNAPDSVDFFDEKGEKYSLDRFEGKTLLVVFWATWCASCVKEMPELDVLQKDFRKLPFEIIPISQDYQGVEVVQKYYKNYDIRYLPIYHDFKNQLFKAFLIVGIPTAILVDPDGKMLMSFTGNINWYDEEIRNIILSNIPGNHPLPKNSYQQQSLNQPVIKKPEVKEQPPKEQESPPVNPSAEQNNDQPVDDKKVKSTTEPKETFVKSDAPIKDQPQINDKSKIKGTDNGKDK